MKSMFRTLVTAMLGVICFAGISFAATAIDFSGTTVDWNDGTNYSLGWSFTTNQELYVNSLGVYAAPEYGTVNRIFSQNHAVGIFDANQNLVASTTVSNADALKDNFFRYHALDSKVTLAANTTYYIAAAMGADQYTWDTTGFSVNPSISYNGSFYAKSDSLAFPAIGDGVSVTNGTFGPNMDFTPTPIPAAFWLLGSGLGMIGAVRRKNAKN
jgi:hypothetical protein